MTRQYLSIDQLQQEEPENYLTATQLQQEEKPQETSIPSQMVDLLGQQIQGILNIPGVTAQAAKDVWAQPGRAAKVGLMGGISGLTGEAERLATLPARIRHERHPELGQFQMQPTQLIPPQLQQTGIGRFSEGLGQMVADAPVLGIGALGGPLGLMGAAGYIGAADAPPGEKGAGTLLSAIESMIPGFGVKGVKKTSPLVGSEAYIKKSVAGRPYDQIQKAQDVVPEGVNLPAHHILESPNMAKDYQRAEGIVLSGTEEPYADLNLALRDWLRKSGINDYGDFGNLPQQVHDAQMPMYKKLVDDTNLKYFLRDEAAKQEGISFNSAPMRKKIIEALNSLPGDAITSGSPSERMYSEPVRDLNYYLDNLNDSTPFHEATKQESVINDALQDAYANKPPTIHRLYSMLREGFEESLKKSKGSDTFNMLSADAREARRKQGEMEFYDKERKQRTPFYAALKTQNVPGNYISSQIKASPGDVDYTSQTKKLMDTIENPELKKQLGLKILSAKIADKKSITAKLNALSKFKIKQLEQLAPPENAEFIKKLTEFNKYHPGLSGKYLDPYTGMFGQKEDQLRELIKSGAKTILGMVPGVASGQVLGGPLGAVLGASATPLYGRYLKSRLTNPKIIDDYLRIHKPKGDQ